MIGLVRIIIGLGILTMGRQLFWLFVGGVGFIFGINLATQILEGRPDETILIFALIAGVISGLFALVLQRIAVTIAGFLGGAVIGVSLLDLLNVETGSTLVPFLLGGIIGAILVSVLFDWALIILSSFTGGTIIIDSIGEYVELNQALMIIMLVFLLTSGIAIQTRMMRRETGNI